MNGISSAISNSSLMILADMTNELEHLAGQHLDCNNNDDGNSYMFSIGMITSYLLVEDEPLFCAIRDYFVT